LLVTHSVNCPSFPLDMNPGHSRVVLTCVYPKVAAAQQVRITRLMSCCTACDVYVDFRNIQVPQADPRMKGGVECKHYLHSLRAVPPSSGIRASGVWQLSISLS